MNEEALLAALDRNTEAVLMLAQAVGMQAEATFKLADECVTLGTMLADPEGDAPPLTDMAGRPIGG